MLLDLSPDMALKMDLVPIVGWFGRARYPDRILCWQSEEGVLQEYLVIVSMDKAWVVYLVPIVEENMKKGHLALVEK